MTPPPLDRCPKCGAPYMSAARPGEARYCYTCNTAGAVTIAPGAKAGEDLELQPIEDAPSSSSGKRGRIPQVAPPTRRTGAIPTAARSSSRAKAVVSSQTVRDDLPPEDIVQTVDAAEAIEHNRGVFTGSNIPQIAPTGSGRMRRSSAPDYVSLAGSIAALCALAFGGWYFFFREKKTAESNLQASSSTAPKSSETIDAKKVATPAAKNQSADPSKPSRNAASIGAASTKPNSVANAIGINDAGTAPKIPVSDSKAALAPKEDSGDVLAKSRKSKGGKFIEEEEPAPAPAKTAAQPAPTPATPDAAPADGDPPSKLTVKDLLANKDNRPDKIETEKKENPFATKTNIPVTAEEPTVMKLDIERIGGNDKTMSQQLQPFLPNWRVRDANMETSKIGIKHQNREQAIQLNPTNDVVPAKLMATVEIPASFATKHPMLLFEASSPATNKIIHVSVRAMNVEILAKQKIAAKKDAEWTPLGVDLSVLANKHFDLQIEVHATPKKKVVEELGFIRNVRIEWSGMKKPEPPKTEAPKPEPPKVEPPK